MSCQKTATAAVFAVMAGVLSTTTAQAGQDNSIAITLEALVLSRTAPAGTDFTGPDNVGNQFVEFEAQDLKTKLNIGGRATLDIPTSFGTFQASLIASGNLLSKGQIRDQGFGGPADTNATYDNDAHLNPGSDVDSTQNSDQLAVLDIKTRSQFYGGELNWQAGNIFTLGNFTPFVGARYLRYTEKLKSVAYDEANDFFGTDNDIDRVNINTSNNLVGVQFGLAGFHPLTEDISIGGKASGGLFLNMAKRKRSFSRDDSATDRFNDTIKKTGFAQVIELNPQIRYKFTDKVHFTLGGFFMWMNGVSAAGSHYDRATDFQDGKIRANKSALFYGGSAGLTIKLN